MFKGKKDFRVVGEDEIINNEYDDVDKDIAIQIRKRRRKRRITVSAVIAVLIAIAVGAYLFVHYQTYETVREIQTYETDGDEDSSYMQFLSGVLKYSKDGVSFMDNKGKEAWNWPYEMKNPIVAASADAAAIGDKGANYIVVLDKNGSKGEIKTTAPIEKITVSDQGIVCAVLSNDNNPEIVCYDAAGNVLVQHKASYDKTGYPMDAAISADGKTLMVSYLSIGNDGMSSKVCYYNFAGEDEDKEISKAEKEYKDTIVPSVFFMNNNLSVHVGDNQMSIISGNENIKETASITFDGEVKSVVNSDKLIGLVVKSKSDYKLLLYDTTGKEVLSMGFSEDYSHIKLVGNEVIMYDGTKCSIILKDGVLRYEGDTGRQIHEIYPVFGVNKYIIISDNGIEAVRLVK